MFDPTTLAWMRKTQTDHMPDTCQRLVFTSAQDDYGQEVETWTSDNVDRACGLEMESGSESQDQRMTVVHWDGTLRLPIETELDTRDRILITKRFGEALLRPLRFEIVGAIQRGPSGIRVKLLRVEDTDSA